MQQTILALGALMIIVMTSINHQRAILMIQEVSHVREMESAAMDVAKFRIEAILNDTEFDEQWLGQTIPPGNVNLMTPSNNFGPDPDNTESPYDDVDDYHLHTEQVPHAIARDTFRFSISYSVSYVDPVSGDTTSANTFAKQITASATSADTIGVRVARAIFSKTTIVSDDF